MATGTAFPTSVISKGEDALHNTSDLGFSTLAAEISGTPATFDVNDATNVEAWPTSNFIVRIERELIFCSSRSGNTITIGTRGYSGTTSADHSSGVDVRVVTASDFIQNQSNEIIALQDVLKGNTQASLTIDGDLTLDNSNGSGDLNVHGDINIVDTGNIQSGGTDAIQVDGSQNVTIPNGDLLVGGTGGTTFDFEVNGNNVALGDQTDTQVEVRLNSDRASSGATIGRIVGRWGGNSLSPIEWVTGDDATNKDEADIVFKTTNAGNTNEVMRLHQEGDVSIGTDTNLSTLFLEYSDGSAMTASHFRTTSDGFTIRNTENSSDDRGAMFRGRVSTSSGDAVGGMAAVAEGPGDVGLRFYVEEANTVREAIAVDEKANVGIGTSSPGNLLDVEGTGSSTTVRVNNTDGASNGNAILKADSASGGEPRVAFSENGTEKYRIFYDVGNTRLDLRDITNSINVLQIQDGEGSIRLPNAGTDTGTTAVFDTNDQIVKDSSTLRHKENVTAITTDDVDPADVLAIDPIRYTRIDSGKPEAGFGAEHFDWGPFSDGLAYDDEDRVAGFLAGSRAIDAAQQIVLKDHDSRITTLEEKVENCDCCTC